MSDYSRHMTNMLSIKTSEDDVMTNDGAITLYVIDFHRLLDNRWLTDNVINAYFKMVYERSVAVEKLHKVGVLNSNFFTKLLSEGNKSFRKWM